MRLARLKSNVKPEQFAGKSSRAS